MSSPSCRYLLLACCLAAMLLAACATPQRSNQPKSYVVLLPRDDGRPSGEVTVTSDQGSLVLNQSWEGAEISAAAQAPAAPVLHDREEVQAAFAPVLGAMPLPVEHFVLYFKLDTTELLAESRERLAEVLLSIERHHPAGLTLVGHTDTVASEGYNLKLGQARADKVLALLREMGAAPATAATFTRGKGELLIRTPDGVWEPRNRRVEITVR